MSVIKLKHLEEINNQTFLERAMLPEFTLLMLYSAFFSWINQVKTQLIVLLCVCFCNKC